MHTSKGQMTSEKCKQDVSKKFISCVISSERAENAVPGLGGEGFQDKQNWLA